MLVPAQRREKINKKWERILTQIRRFIKTMRKVRKFNPRGHDICLRSWTQTQKSDHLPSPAFADPRVSLQAMKLGTIIPTFVLCVFFFFNKT